MNVLQFCINTSGRTYPVYDTSNGGSVKVGDLYNREAFVIYGGEGCYLCIKFLDPNGNFRTAVIDTYTHPLEYSSCLDKPYSETRINNSSKIYSTFLMRRSMPIYNPNGTRWGTVAAGCLVATLTPTVGENHNDWKEISYVQNSSGNWVKVTDGTYSHGFVDTGIASASGHTTIPFYGSW